MTKLLSSLSLMMSMAGLWLLSSCGDPSAAYTEELVVTATAYNATAAQTNSQPAITAFGDTLRPGIKAIAVSRDLLDSGLVYGTSVQIEGLPGTYQVMDKMARRWRKKIDIYLGDDVQAAKNWGKQSVTIRWAGQEEA
jgi:3D (Asp-Asp-Asp) domain-containing protein